MFRRSFAARAVPLMLAVASLAGCAGAQAPARVDDPPTPEAAPLGEYRIGPADLLQVSVWKNETLSRAVPVRPDGMISLPLINEVRAAGLTPMQLQGVLEKKLAEYIPNPEVSVIVQEVHSLAVSVLGEVKTAGRYEFKSRTTVLDALARAGGITEFANRSRILILRQQGSAMKRIVLNYDELISAQEGQEIFFVQPGDVVVVP